MKQIELSVLMTQDDYAAFWCRKGACNAAGDFRRHCMWVNCWW